MKRIIAAAITALALLTLGAGTAQADSRYQLDSRYSVTLDSRY